MVATIFYGGIRLALAMVFSTVFRQPAAAALGSIAVWIFFMAFWSINASLLAQSLSPVQHGYTEEMLAQAQLEPGLSRISPNTLYAEIMVELLQPTMRFPGIVLPSQLQGAVIGSALPLKQSVLLIKPQLTSLIAATNLLFTPGYILFQRQEIRT